MHRTVAAHQTKAALIAVLTVGDSHCIIDLRAAATEGDKGHGQVVVEATSGAVTGDDARIALSAGA